MLADLAGQRSSVTVTGWDVAGKQRYRSRPTTARWRRSSAAATAASSVLRTALGERKETVSLDRSARQRERPRRAPRHCSGRRARRFVRGHGIAETDAGLRVGAIVQLDGLGPLFSGDYYVAEVTHRFDAEHGLRTEFAVERPGLGRAA